MAKKVNYKINPKFHIGQKVLVEGGTHIRFLNGPQQDVIKDIQISITKKGISYRYHLESESHYGYIFKENKIRAVEE